MKKLLYIIRHGETDFNQQGIVQGKGVDSSINALGQQQAHMFFERYRHIGFEKIYVSNLQRTEQTIAPFKALNIPLVKHHGLDEISWGIHEGQSNGDSFKEFYRVLHRWQQGETNLAIEGGETPEEVQLRQRLFIADLLGDPEEKVLICSHGRAIRILLCTMLNEPLAKMDTFPHQNVSLYKLLYDGSSFSLDTFNDVSHLHAD